MDQWPGAPSVYFGTTGSGAARLTDEGARVGRKRSKVGVGYSAVVQQFVEQIKQYTEQWEVRIGERVRG